MEYSLPFKTGYFSLARIIPSAFPACCGFFRRRLSFMPKKMVLAIKPWPSKGLAGYFTDLNWKFSVIRVTGKT